MNKWQWMDKEERIAYVEGLVRRALQGFAMGCIVVAVVKAPSIRAVVPAVLACACALLALTYNKP